MGTMSSLETTILFGEQLIKDYTDNKEMDSVGMVVLSLLRRIVELSDGVFVSAKHNLDGPASLCFRGLIESYLSFEYILLVPELIDRRALAYYIGYQNQELETAEKKLKTLNKDKDQNDDDIKYYEKIIDEYKLLLKRDYLSETVQEWEKVKKKINKNNKRYKINPKWYSLFNGPTSVNMLARNIAEEKYSKKKLGIDVLYNYLSLSAHSYSSLDSFDIIDGKFYLQPTRILKQNNEKSFHMYPTIAILISTYLSFIKNKYPQYISNYDKLFATLENTLLMNMSNK